MSILDNQRFNPRFKSHFAGKLFVAIGEGHIPLQNKMTREMIKNMATGKVMRLEGKSSNAEMVENLTHLLFCSNDERKFMQIELNYTLDDVTRELNRAAEVKFPKSKIKELLAEKYNIKPGESLRYVCFSEDIKGETVEQKKKGRYCTFYAQNWLTPEEYSDLFSEGHKEQG